MNKIRILKLIVAVLALALATPLQMVYADPYQPPVTNAYLSIDNNVQPPVGVPPSAIPTMPDGTRIRQPLPQVPNGRFQIMAPVPPTIITDPRLDMKVLVLHNPTWDFGNYTTITAYLDILGIPYDTIDTGTTAITAALLSDGNHGKYYAIFFTFSGQWWGDLDASEQTAISDYEMNFSVRQVTWYTYPDPTYSGMTVGAPPTETLTATLTTDGQAIFPYLRSDIQLVKRAIDYAYPGTPVAGADITTLMEDNNGNVALAIYRPGDGREHMVFTWPNFYPATIPAFLYSRVLPYGIINWATKGIFLGQRHVYFVPQPDDVLSWGDVWDPANHVLLEGQYYRLEPNDLDNIVAWMANLRANTPNAADFKMEMPFNGDGSAQDRVNGNGAVNSGTLTAKAVELENEFIWLNHTYTHADLYFTDYATNYQEIDQNNQLAAFLGFTDYTNQTLLTGAYSGITNTALIDAAYNLGVRYLLVNASYPQYDNPTPNTGIPHPHNNAVLQVPRHANNVFYFSTTPEMETDYYNWTYCPAYRANPIPANRCLEYPDVIDAITNQSLENLLDFNVNATMFHMNNLEIYNESTGGTDTILSDFVASLYGKYNALYNDNVPILSLRTQEIGALMWERAAYDAAGVSAVWSCGDALTVTTTNGARIPITGVDYGSDTESYADQTISYLTIGDNATVSVPGTESPTTPAAPTGLAVAVSGSDNILTWDATTQDTNGGALTALAYRVYRSTDPNFVPDASTLLADKVPDPTYTDAGAATGGYTYAVAAIGDNCWKRESDSTRVAPTAVDLINLSTRVIENGIEITWETASELDTVGFNLYRATMPEGDWTQINTALIPSQAPGGILGATYTYTDDTVNPSLLYYYRLEEVNITSVSTYYGPVAGGLDADPSAITLMDLQARTTPTGVLAQIAIAVLVAGSIIGISQRSKRHQS